MIRAIWVGVVLAALGTAGCWEIGDGGKQGKPPQSAGSALPVRPPPPVSAEQVNDANAHQMREALRARATVGEVCGALRDVWGTYRPTERF